MGVLESKLLLLPPVYNSDTHISFLVYVLISKNMVETTGQLIAAMRPFSSVLECGGVGMGECVKMTVWEFGSVECGSVIVCDYVIVYAWEYGSVGV